MFSIWVALFARESCHSHLSVVTKILHARFHCAVVLPGPGHDEIFMFPASLMVYFPVLVVDSLCASYQSTRKSEVDEMVFTLFAEGKN